MLLLIAFIYIALFSALEQTHCGMKGQRSIYIKMTKCQKVCKESGQKGLNFFKLMSV